MADILEFRTEVLRTQGAGPGPRGNAEIVFFPGVRYERSVEEPKAPAAKPRRSRVRTRDVLELDE